MDSHDEGVDAPTVESLKRELELVKASKRAERDETKTAKYLAATLDELRRQYALSLFERDLLVGSMATWRARALLSGWKEEATDATQ